MSKHLIFIFSIIYTFLSNADNSNVFAIARNNYLKLRLSSSELETLNNTVTPSVSLDNILLSYGVKRNNFSKVMIHEEDGFVNLSCFNCITREVDGKFNIMESVNAEGLE